MRTKKIIWICFFIVIFQITAYAQNTIDTNYNYSYWGDVQEDIPFFELVTEIDMTNMGDVKLSSMDDVHVTSDKIYIVDSIESRINIFNYDLELMHSIKVIRDSQNKIVVDPKTNQQLVLKNPEGVFFHESLNELYIADTGAERIIILDADTYQYKRTIESPTNMVGQTVFRPSKIAVDRTNRIYVIVQSGFEGIVELESTGEFSRYFGVNKPKVNLLDYFWRSMASEEQKKKMDKVFAPSFNNITIDGEGFILATTSDNAARDKVFRLNPKGENVLRENGYFNVIGDLPAPDEMKLPSMFTDIAVTDYGTYALLDKAKGRIFIYNFDGELLNIFNNLGFMRGNLREPSAIDWIGNNLIVTDKQLKKAFIYQPTYIGELGLSAAEAYYNGEWGKASTILEEAIKVNKNYEMAYTSIGKNYLMQEEYEKAMYYFKLGSNREYYSKAYNGYRSIWIQEHFEWIFAIALLLIVAVIYSEYKYMKKQR